MSTSTNLTEPANVASAVLRAQRIAPLSPSSPSYRWSVLHVRGGQEIHVDNLLHAAGQGRYLPMFTRRIRPKAKGEHRTFNIEHRTSKGRKAIAGNSQLATGNSPTFEHVPLFPNYTFHFGDRAAVADNPRVMEKLPDGVESILHVADQGRLVEELLHVERLIALGGANLGSSGNLKIGQRVRVCAGAWLGQEGVVTKLDGKPSRRQRLVWINLKTLGQSVGMEVPARDLEVLEQVGGRKENLNLADRGQGGFSRRSPRLGRGERSAERCAERCAA